MNNRDRFVFWLGIQIVITTLLHSHSMIKFDSIVGVMMFFGIVVWSLYGGYYFFVSLFEFISGEPRKE